eukprot:2053293-Pyramimonas_sp.AAC.1
MNNIPLNMKIGYINSRMMGKRLGHTTEDARVTKTIHHTSHHPAIFSPPLLSPHPCSHRLLLRGRPSGPATGAARGRGEKGSFGANGGVIE